MNTKIKIIRVLYGDRWQTMQEIPPFPIYKNQVVYVWGKENEKMLKDRGYSTIFMSDGDKDLSGQAFIRKLIALDRALKDFGEVILLDWDAYILRPIDDKFYEYLKEKPIQCPLYAQHYNVSQSYSEIYDPYDPKNFSNPENEGTKFFYKECDVNFRKYSWRIPNDKNTLVTPNFGFFYSRDKNVGEKLLNIAVETEMHGCIEEHVMWLYANCSLDEYIKRYQPVVIKGVSDRVIENSLMMSKTQGDFNKFMNTKINFDIYLEHI